MSGHEFWWVSYRDGAPQVVTILRDQGGRPWFYFAADSAVMDGHIPPAEGDDIRLIERVRAPGEVEALADAMWQLLDDMGAKGTSVCELAKARARVAFDPFRLDALGEEAPLDYTLEAAQALVSDVEWQRARMAGRDRA